MDNPLALLFDAYAVFSEHHDEGPVVYALIPADNARVAELLGLEPARRLLAPTRAPRMDRPTFVADGSVARGTVSVWADAEEYARQR